MESLVAARAALQQGARGSALEALLEAWRASRDPALADCLTEAGAEAARALPALKGKTRKAFHEEWMDLAEKQRPVDVPRLLAGLQNPPWGFLHERIARLRAAPDDPRVGLALAHFIEALPVRSSVKPGHWRELIALIDRTRDVRCVGPLQRRLAVQRVDSLVEQQTIFPASAKVVTRLQGLEATPVPPELLAQLRQEIARLAAGPPATEGQLAAPARTERNGPKLLAAIYADPGNDVPRLVYADWLLERGELHGEFITLQFRGASGKVTQAQLKQERALLKLHAHEWLGPIEPAVVREGMRFEKGFLTVGSARFRSARQQQALGAHPAWSTLRELCGPEQSRELLAMNPLIGLRRISAPLDDETLAVVASRTVPLPNLEWLTLAGEEGEEGRKRLVRSTALPALTTLGVTSAPNGVTWLRGTPLGKRLRRLILDSWDFELPRWRKLCDSFPALERLDVEGDPHLAFCRDSKGWRLELSQVQGIDATMLALDELKGKIERVVLADSDLDEGLQERLSIGFKLLGMKRVRP